MEYISELIVWYNENKPVNYDNECFIDIYREKRDLIQKIENAGFKIEKIWNVHYYCEITPFYIKHYPIKISHKDGINFVTEIPETFFDNIKIINMANVKVAGKNVSIENCSDLQVDALKIHGKNNKNITLLNYTALYFYRQIEDFTNPDKILIVDLSFNKLENYIDMNSNYYDKKDWQINQIYLNVQFIVKELADLIDYNKKTTDIISDLRLILNNRKTKSARN